MKIVKLALYTALLACLSSDVVKWEAPLVEEPAQPAPSVEQYPKWVMNGGEEASSYTIQGLGDVERLETRGALRKEESLPVYYYGDPVPESQPVEAEYFANAAIIGDSRSQGLMAYGGLGGGENLTGLGLSVYNIWDKPYVEGETGTVTMLEALANEQYARVYVGLGVNSLGYPSVEKFYHNYTQLIEEIIQVQPEADIYVQSIIPLNEGVLEARGSGDYFANAKVEDFNQYIQRVAREKDLYYLDLYNFFLDEEGQLPKEASGDGIHLTVDYTKIWAEFLKCHVIDTDAYTILSSTQESESLGEESDVQVYLDTPTLAVS